MTEQLTHRERLLRTLRRQPVDRVPDYEFRAWTQTIDRWRDEGMDVPSLAGMGNQPGYLEPYFGTDDAEFGPGLSINVRLLPAFEPQVIEERGENWVIQDGDGALSEQLKPEFGASIPRYIRYAIQTRADWERMRDERLDPARADRIPVYLDALAYRLNHASYPVTVHVGSLYGWIRNWMGVENLSLMLYDDLPLVEEMMEHLTRLTLSVLERMAGRGLRIDRADWWEDMCFRSGSLLSTRLFARLMVPRYKRITDFLRQEFGTEFNQLDCDGNIHQLAPLWLDGGINVMFPVEAAHTDPVRLAGQLGTRGIQRGSFDKRALIEGPAAIDAELAKLRPLVERGDVIPHTDHLVPPDVPFNHYVYYRRKKLELIGKPWREPGVARRPGQIRDWRLLGPFDNTANAGFHAVLPPEEEAEVKVEVKAEKVYSGKDGRPLKWQAHRSTYANGYVNLAQAITADPWVVGYAACELHAADECDAWFDLGSDDGIKVWLNGEPILNKDVYRIAGPAQDLIAVRLRQGWNAILCKIGQAEGDWGFNFRVTDALGRPWEDVRVRV
jgi:uroporphyrinogen decarboxylase